MSPIADDPRVRRQGQALHEAGWRVCGAGMPGAKSPPPEWPIYSRDTLAGADLVEVREPPAPMALATTLGGEYAHGPLRQIDRLLRRMDVEEAARRDDDGKYRHRLLSIRWRPREAHSLYWSFSSNVHDIYRCASKRAADLWLANDWSVLPIAARLAKEMGGVYVYDTHELASDEYGQDLNWRIYQKPLVDAMEGASIVGAAGVSAISQGICDKLLELYPLKVTPREVRNTPLYVEHAYRPCGERVRVLYHGVVVPGRGLEAAIESMALWPSDFDLTFRGPISDGYRAELEALIARHGLENRVELASPVHMTELIASANAYDIGLCTPPAHSLHNYLSLPNKVFEYIMAGLALFLTPLPEHERLVKDFGVGFLTTGEDPAALGAAMRQITREKIEAAKRNALVAARTLCWEQERSRFYALCSEAMGCVVAPVGGR